MLHLQSNIFIVCGQTMRRFPQLVSPGADGCDPRLGKFSLEISCVLVRDGGMTRFTNQSHRFLFSQSLYVKIYAFLYIFFILKKKAATAASYLNLGMESLDCEIPAFPLTCL